MNVIVICPDTMLADRIRSIVAGSLRGVSFVEKPIYADLAIVLCMQEDIVMPMEGPVIAVCCGRINAEAVLKHGAGAVVDGDQDSWGFRHDLGHAVKALASALK